MDKARINICSYFKKRVFHVLAGCLERKGYVVRKSIYSSSSLYKNQVIFIHVPKVAGMSVLKSLDIAFIGHVPLFRYEQDDPVRFKDFFKIGFVRNPWDRVVSAFHFLKQGGLKNEYDISMQNRLAIFDNFSEFINGIFLDKALRKEILIEIHFRPQYYWLTNSVGELEMDYIGRFESLPADFDILKEKLNRTQAVLTKINASKHLPFWSYYNKDLVARVGSIYQRDVELFDYEFPFDEMGSTNS